jgi:hypothetical protein
MAEMMVVAEEQSARRLMHTLRAKKMIVSQMNDATGRTAVRMVRLLVRVPAYRMQEVFETLASNG